MNNYTPLYYSTFEDRKFRKTSIEGGYLFLSFLGNSRQTLTGIYEMNLDDYSVRAKLNSNFEAAFKEIQDNGMVKWDAESELIWVVNRFKLHPAKNRMVVVGAIKELNRLNHPFKDEFIKKYHADLKGYLMLLEGYKEEPRSAPTRNDCPDEQEVRNLAKINMSEQSIKDHFLHRGFSEHKIDEVLGKVKSK